MKQNIISSNDIMRENEFEFGSGDKVREEQFTTPNIPIIKKDYGKSKLNGLEQDGAIKLRLAIIDNPEINRPNSIGFDPTDADEAVNDNTGKVSLRWIGMSGGVINPDKSGSKTGKITSYNPEDRTLDETRNSSIRELVPLTHPFLWAGPDNWCGYNYLPPIGAKVIVGFGKSGLPYILGYLNPHYKICTPFLRPGEICNKGYGNNYIHNRWSNKLDLKAWVTAGEQDIDDPSAEKSASEDCTLWIRMDADNANIEISANSSVFYLTPDTIAMSVAGTSMFSITSDTVAITANNFVVNSANMDTNGARISHN